MTSGTGRVLASTPTTRCTFGSAGGRPELTQPNTTSARSLYRCSTIAHAACTMVATVTRCLAAAARSSWIHDAESWTSRRSTAPVACCGSAGRSGISRFGATPASRSIQKRLPASGSCSANQAM